MNKRILLAAIGVPLLGLLVACGGSSKNNNTTTSNNVVGTASTVAPSGASASTGSAGSTAPKATTASTGASANNGGANSNTALLVTVLTNFSNSKKWRAEIKDSSDPTSNGTFEYVAPDKFHVTLSNYEIISIGSDTYIKQGATWVKVPATGSSGPLFDTSSLQDTISAAQSASVTKGGTDTVNGTKCQIYTYTDTASNNKVEVCVADNLPVRVVQDDGESVSTTTFDFKSNIDIKAPI